MTTFIGSRIVTDGLLVYLDAANPASYPGSGSVWYDLMGNANSALINGASYSSVNGGVIVTDGVNDYVDVPINIQNVNYTVMATSRYVGAPYGRIVSSAAGTTNWLLGHWSNTTENYFAGAWVTPVGSGPLDTNWRIYAGTGDYGNDLWSFYVNGQLKAGPNTSGVNGPVGIVLGSYRGSSEFSNAQIANLLVYNRVLTASEIQQNYNTLRSRFGI